MTNATNDSNDFILHHYDGSPFSEKLRLVLGYKNLDWLSVKVPVIMPKPDVVALTGGHRRTPVAQVGADVYCDSALIAQLLERRAPAPTLFPTEAPLAPLLAQWADFTLFWAVIPYTMQPAGLATIFKGVPPEVIKAFGADRAPFSAGMRRQTVADAQAALSGHFAALEAQLADGRAYLFGSVLSIADFSVAHCCWYVRRGGATAELVQRHPHLDAWLDRMLAIGHGRPQAISSAQALAMAASTSTFADTQVQPGMGFDAGQHVTVAAIDYGTEPSAGVLVGLDNHVVVIERHDERAGTLHVHFPRRGFQIRLQETTA